MRTPSICTAQTKPTLALRYRKRRLRRDSPLTEAPRFLRVFPSGLYVESASRNGFYNLSQGALSKAAQLPQAYTYEMTQHGAWLLRSAGAAGLQLVNFESPPHRLFRPNSTMVTASKMQSSTGGLWLAEQPERLRRITTPSAFRINPTHLQYVT